MSGEATSGGLDQGGSPSILVYNERIEYTATWLNTIAAGAIVVGVGAPLTAWVIGGTFDASVLVSLVWLPIGAGLHYLCRWVLSDLREEAKDERP